MTSHLPYASAVLKNSVATSSGSGGSGDSAGKSLSYFNTSYVSGTLPDPRQNGHQSLGICGRFCLADATITQSFLNGLYLNSAILIPLVVYFIAADYCYSLLKKDGFEMR
jgi:hypothetical protein